LRVTFRHVPPKTVLYARALGPYALSTREAWTIMGRWLDRHGARPHMRVSMGVFLDNPATTAADLLRYDACVPLVAGLEADPVAGIGRQTLAGGAYAEHVLVGTHEAMGRIFSHMKRSALAERGVTLDSGRPFVAVYLNDPTVTAQAYLRTEICVPVLPVRLVLANDDASTEPVTHPAAKQA
jgi:AraC family transcriptional regulator